MEGSSKGDSVWTWLTQLLAHEHSDLRMSGLHLLSESYAGGSELLENVFSIWDREGPEEAFVEFPMLSFVPISDSKVQDCCLRAQRMVAGRKLTEFPARCAGKLIEQFSHVSPSALEANLLLIKETVASSKIFFRVSVEAIEDRIQLLECSADQIAAVLDDAVATLSADPQKQRGFKRGLIALEALRARFPDYIDLSVVLGLEEGEDGLSPSQTVSLHSLIQKSSEGMEASIEKFLRSSNEAVFSNAVEAMVRAGTVSAAESLLRTVEEGEIENRKWAARGLQRIRLPKLAAGIAAARDQARDPYLWIMLLIAEVRQFEADSIDRIAFDLARLQSGSKQLVGSLRVFLEIHKGHVEIGKLQETFISYLSRTESESS
ncbi:MAG: hypothetical protein AB8B50_08450 [Pirellulaceae bacterium]